MVAVQVVVHRTDGAAEHALERHGHRIDDGDREPQLARRCGDLGADPTGTDHDDSASASEPLAQSIRVRLVAEVQDPVQVAARDAEPEGLRACGEQQPVVLQSRSVVERDIAGRRVESHRRAAENELDAVIVVEAAIVHEQFAGRDVAAEVALRKRWALVRALLLVAEQDHTPVEAFGAQRLRSLGAGKTGADDHERLCG